MSQAPFRILVDLPPNTAYWRGVIAGVAAYCRADPRATYGLPEGFEPLVEEPREPDGLVTIVGDEAAARHAARFGKPVVNVSSVGHNVPFPSVVTDNRAIGALAADHLLAQGYAFFACHMESRVDYSVERLQGFEARLATVGKRAQVFDSSPAHGAPEDPAELRRATADWLRGLRKPVGLMAHNDARACGILTLCAEAGIKAPEEVGVVGVDDDRFLAESCRPTLSSVDNAPAVVGYRAAQALVANLEGRSVPWRSLVPPRRVVQRQSTHPSLTDDPLLARAVGFIRQRACEPIGIKEVLQEVPLSRRSLERRFRERLGRSPAEEIGRVRIDRAKGLLGDSDLPIGAVAEAVGYGQSRNFATAFRREVGMEPRAYRALFGAKLEA